MRLGVLTRFCQPTISMKRLRTLIPLARLVGASVALMAVPGCATPPPSATLQPAPHPFADTTLFYESHTSDWAVYLGESSAGTAPYVGQQFEGRGGARTSGSYSYRVKKTPDGRWLLELRGPSSAISQTVVVLPNFTKVARGATKGTGNILQPDGQPLWPGGMDAMTFTFLPGRHLSSAVPPSAGIY